MNKLLAIVLGFFGLLGLLVVWGISINNTIINHEESVKRDWGQVQNVYQRRLDLVPNLVESVKGAAKHEKETLQSVIEARSNVAKLSAESMTDLANDPAKLKQFQQAQSALGSTLSRLMVVVERYPELKANQNFLELQSQLEGTENRIAVERKRFNDSVRVYNGAIRVFPGSLIAGFRNFKERPYFEAAPEAEKAPQVKF